MQTNFSKSDNKFNIMQITYDEIPNLMSKETINYHFSKHHVGYVNKLNGIIANENFQSLSLNLEELQIKGLMKFSHQNLSHDSQIMQSVFNNAAQIYNHDFFWNGLLAEKIKMSVNLEGILNNNFGSLDDFFAQFTQIAMNHFGSGWCWIVQNQDKSLSIESTKDAYNPLLNEKPPLWTCDLWEHAYYIDYKNDRALYLSKIFEFINWDFVESNLI